MESWRSLIQANWGDYVVLHNLPFGFVDQEKDVDKIEIIKKSYYELQKSAINWDIYDF